MRQENNILKKLFIKNTKYKHILLNTEPHCNVTMCKVKQMGSLLLQKKCEKANETS